jgi:hypothetical protein
VDEEVFSTPAWQEYARDHLILVRIELSKEEFMDMRTVDPVKDALRIQYDVTGYPSFVLLDDDGETELGRFGFRKLSEVNSTSPQAFHDFLEGYLHFRSIEIDRTVALFSPPARSLYLELAAQRKTLLREYKEMQSQLALLRRKFWAASAEHRERVAEKEELGGGDPAAMAQLDRKIEQAFQRKKEAAQSRSREKPVWALNGKINRIEAIMNSLRKELTQCDRLPAIPQELQAAIDGYQELPEKKALYIAVEPDGRFALGAGHGKITWNEAMIDAYNALQIDCLKKRISARAVLYALDNRILHETKPYDK